jgi:phosphotriesterase-related protein
MAKVQSVLGEIDVKDMGITITHEHLLIDARKAWYEPKEATKIALAQKKVSMEILHELRQDPYMNWDNCFMFDEDVAVSEAQQFQHLGGSTIVDATCLSIGRDPQALQRISKRTGLHVLMGCGYYLESRHLPHVKDASIDELAAEMVQDVLEGTEGTNIRAGYIGEIGVSKNFTAQEEKVLRASARAQAKTGVALSIHLPGWERLAHRVLDVIAEEGGNIHKTILDHMNPSFEDVKYQTSLAERGAYLEYDMIGMDYYYANEQSQSPSDEDNAKAIKNLIDLGFANKLLLSQDVFLKMMLTCYGGNGYAYVLRHFVPRLRCHGVSQETIQTMLVDNPARVFGVDQ